MKDLLFMTAKLLPEDYIINEMQKALTNYQILKTDDAKKELNLWTAVFISKDIIKDKDPKEVAKDIEKMKSIYDMFNNQKN